MADNVERCLLRLEVARDRVHSIDWLQYFGLAPLKAAANSMVRNNVGECMMDRSSSVGYHKPEETKADFVVAIYMLIHHLEGSAQIQRA